MRPLVQVDRGGITRYVVLVGPVAIKVPRPDRQRSPEGMSLLTTFVRGWLANRSEWKQRRRPDAATPLLTLGHLVLVMPRADLVGRLNMPGPVPWPVGSPAAAELESRGDEIKPSSWGYFGRQWLLIDFDRAWDPPRGLVGGLYYGHQERLARRWSKL